MFCAVISPYVPGWIFLKIWNPGGFYAIILLSSPNLGDAQPQSEKLNPGACCGVHSLALAEFGIKDMTSLKLINRVKSHLTCLLQKFFHTGEKP